MDHPPARQPTRARPLKPQAYQPPQQHVASTAAPAALFVNWLRQHRSGRGIWPCNERNPDHSLASLDAMTQSILTDEGLQGALRRDSAD